MGSTVTATRTLYPFAGSMVAQRTSGAGSGFVYLHADHLGGVIATTLDTGRGGQAGSSARYLPWGGVRSGGIAETTVNFTGQHRDGLGLLYYGARYYDPALGRFLSPDSIGTSPGNPQSLNRYAYVLNNPVNHTDPSGHCPEGAGCNDQYGGAGAATGLDDGGGSGAATDNGGFTSDDGNIHTNGLTQFGYQPGAINPVSGFTFNGIPVMGWSYNYASPGTQGFAIGGAFGIYDPHTAVVLGALNNLSSGWLGEVTLYGTRSGGSPYPLVDIDLLEIQTGKFYEVKPVNGADAGVIKVDAIAGNANVVSGKGEFVPGSGDIAPGEALSVEGFVYYQEYTKDVPSAYGPSGMRKGEVLWEYDEKLDLVTAGAGAAVAELAAAYRAYKGRPIQFPLPGFQFCSEGPFALACPTG